MTNEKANVFECEKTPSWLIPGHLWRPVDETKLTTFTKWTTLTHHAASLFSDPRGRLCPTKGYLNTPYPSSGDGVKFDHREVVRRSQGPTVGRVSLLAT